MAQTKRASNPQKSAKVDNNEVTAWRGIASATLASAAGQWLLLFVLIFGGCCSNAWALEWTTHENPRAGSLITFAQYLIVTIWGLRGRFTSTPPYTSSHPQPKKDVPDDRSRTPRPDLLTRILAIHLKPLAVPLSRWLIQVVLFLGVSLLNNAAFGYRVPMAVHIIFRSGGLVANMILGYLTQGRRYSIQQVCSVILITVGIAAATTSGAKGSTSTASASSAPSIPVLEYSIGIAMLTLALVLATFLGFAQEKTYGKYGRHWEEGMFFLHFLALPMFAFFGNDLVEQIRFANASPRVSLIEPLYALAGASSARASYTAQAGVPPLPLPLAPIWKIGILPSTLPAQIQKRLDRIALPDFANITIPSFWIPLTLNVLTQLICVSGVNRLTARVSSLSVMLILTLRKAVSLVISVVLIGGSKGSAQLWAGSFAVLSGTILYSLGPKPQPRKDEKQKKD